MRKLVFAAVGYTAALLTAHYILPGGWILPAAAVCAAAALCALLLKADARRRFLILSLSAAIGFGWTSAYEALFISPADRLVGEEMRVSARVRDYPSIYDNYSSVEVVLAEEGLPRCRVLVYDYSAGLEELRPGDILSMDLEFRSARSFYGAESDRYLSSGIFLRATLKEEPTFLGRWEHSLLCLPAEFAREIKESVERCFPADVAHLVKALLTGDKRDYYEDDGLYTSMQTAGLSHIVAVSGMHVAFIISMISLGTGRRRVTAFIGLPLVFVFMAMVGFTPSVVRAGLMQAFLLLAPILRRENDAPTSLAAALLLLLLINPQSVGSAGLQLSFAAMAGIILVSPRVYDFMTRDEDGDYRFSGRRFGGAFRKFSGLFSSSLGAMVFTSPVAALHFGFLPLYSVLTNLLCVWAMSAAFTLGYVVALVGLVLPAAGQILGWLVAWLPRYAMFVVEHISRLPGAALYTGNNMMAWWLVYAYAVFAVAWLGRGRERFRPAVPLCLCVIGLCTVVLASSRVLEGENGLRISAIDVGQGQSVAAMTENATVLIDCGNTGQAENAGDSAARYLGNLGRSRIDLLILTHLHSDHANGVERLMNRMDVERIALPSGCEDDASYGDIMRCCHEQGTQVYYIEENTDFSTEGLTLRLYAPLTEKDINERGLMISGDYGEYQFLVTGDAPESVEDLLMSFYEPEDMELLIVGHHGSKYSTGERLLDGIKPETAFISVGTNNYGHPAEETLQRLRERGIEYYRTDLNGNISITVGSEDG